jgi:hypothetical protein
MKPDDILWWQDGSWCFREELDQKFLRRYHYRAIPCDSNEGQRMLAARPTLRLPLAK